MFRKMLCLTFVRLAAAASSEEQERFVCEASVLLLFPCD